MPRPTRRPLPAAPQVDGAHHVGHDHGGGDRAHAARHRRQRSGDLGHRIALDVAHQLVAHLIGAGIDHRRAGPDHRSGHQARYAGGHHYHVRLAQHRPQVARAGVAHRDGGVTGDQRGGQGTTHGRAAAHHGDRRAANGPAAALDHADAGQRRSRQERPVLAAVEERRPVGRGDAVHVLGRMQTVAERRQRYAGRQRQLDDQPVDVRVVAGAADRGGRLGRRRLGRQPDDPHVDAEPAAKGALGPGVPGGRRVIADQQHLQARRPAGGRCRRRGACAHLFPYGGGDVRSGDDRYAGSAHSSSAPPVSRRNRRPSTDRLAGFGGTDTDAGGGDCRAGLGADPAPFPLVAGAAPGAPPGPVRSSARAAAGSAAGAVTGAGCR